MSDPGSGPRRVTLPTELVIRQSTIGRVPAGLNAVAVVDPWRPPVGGSTTAGRSRSSRQLE
jgi:hypothetical protein